MKRGGPLLRRQRKSKTGAYRAIPPTVVTLVTDRSGCHGWVTEHPALAGDEGTHVPSWLDPAEVPVTTLGRTVWLADDGGVSGQAPEEAAS